MRWIDVSYKNVFIKRRLNAFICTITCIIIIIIIIIMITIIGIIIHRFTRDSLAFTAAMTISLAANLAFTAMWIISACDQLFPLLVSTLFNG